MTPQPQQEEPTYLISERLLNHIITCSMRTEEMGCSDCPYAGNGVNCAVSSWEDEIRSRPVPLTHDDTGNCLIICRHCGRVTQVQCTEAVPSPCEENGCTDIDNCDEICIHQRIYSQAQMDGSVAQAREDVLDELCENIKEDFKEDFDGELMINYQDFLWNVESLRSHEVRP